MRFLVAHPGPQFSVHDLYVGWSEALRAAGQAVFQFPLGDALTFYEAVLMEAGDGAFKRALTVEQAVNLAVDRLYASVLKVRPHVLLVVSGFFLPREMFDIVRAAGVRVVLVHTESPYEDDRQLKLAGHVDLNLVNDPTNIDAFRALAPTEYLCHAYRPSLHHPGAPHPDLACDLAFVGTGYPSRVEFLEAMDLSGVDVALAGNWLRLGETSPLRPFVAHDLQDCFDNTDAADLYRSARAGLNFYRREAEADHLSAGWAMGPREVEMAACGLFYLRDPRAEGDDLLPMLPTFDGPREASELLRWWLAHDRERERAAVLAREAVADRTFDAHAARLLRLLDA